MTSRNHINNNSSNDARLVHVHLDPSSNPNGSHQVITFPDGISVGDFRSLDTALIDIATFTECDPQLYQALPGKNVLTKPTDMLTRGKHYVARFYENENEMNSSNNNASNTSSSSSTTSSSSSKKSVAFHPHATIREYSISLIHNSNSMSLSPATSNNNNSKDNSLSDSFGVMFSNQPTHHHLNNQMLPAGAAAVLPNLQQNIMPLQEKNQQQQRPQKAKSFQFPIVYEYAGQQYYVRDESEVDRLLNNDYVNCKAKKEVDADFERLIGGGGGNANVNNNNNNNLHENNQENVEQRKNNFAPRGSVFIP